MVEKGVIEKESFSLINGHVEDNLPPKPKDGRKGKTEGKIDLRPIEPAYFHPYKNYTIEEAELFKEPTELKHFKKRLDILLKRRREGRLVFLPKGDGIFLLALKEYVLNEIPTQNKELRDKTYLYLGKSLKEKEKDEINENYAKYIQNFKTNLNSKKRKND